MIHTMSRVRYYIFRALLIHANFQAVIRVMKECAGTWGDAKDYYLRATLTFADRFEGWSF